MSTPARQSYYEVALTSRQVISVFVVLLVAVLAAFLSGVWVGRQNPDVQFETVEAQAIEAAGEEDDAPLARLEFFSRNGEAGDQPVADAQPEPAAPAPPPPIEEAPAPRKAAEPAPAVAEPETRVAQAPAPEPPPAATDPSPEQAAAPSGSLVVQVFSSNNQVQAQSVVDQLRSGGYPALLSPVEVSGRTMYRVRIGPYADRKVAEGIAEQVRSRFRLETWITE